jgi:translation initiation factor IF-2
MSDDNENRGGRERAPLTLKPRGGGAVNAGTVKQSFSHGRTKTVVVETKRRRVEAPGPGSERSGPQGFDVARPRPAAPAAPAAPRPAPPPADGNLSSSEMAARQRALDAAREAQERRDAEIRAQEAARAAEAEAGRHEAEARAQAERAAAPPAASEEAPAPAAAAPAAPAPAAPAEPPEAERPAVAAAPTPEPAPTPVRTSSLPERPRDLGRPIERPTPAGFAPRSSSYTDRPRSDGPGGYSARPPRSDSAQGYGARPGGGGGFAGDRPRSPGGFAGDRPREGAGYGARSGGPGFGSGERAPRSDAGGYGARAPRPEGGAAGGGGGGYGTRPPGPGETVRYSALSPRPAGPRDGARPGGPRPPPGARGPAAAPSGPEVSRPSRAGPRTGADRRPGEDDRRGKGGAEPGKAVSRLKGEPSRRQGRLTIQAVAGDEDAAERMRSLASVRRAREREKEKRRGGGQEQAQTSREVVIPDVITVQELSNRMAVRGVEIIKFMMRQGMMLKINDVIDSDTAELVATEFGHTVRRVSEADVEEGFLDASDAAEDTLPRAPVVAVMGHVDHGKTSLLDALRSAKVASGEAGGITQHIGAYQVKLENGQRVTFLDTPGHAAFSAMRARGANVTDIVILVVAADDGVMPQTIEAIHHAKAAGSPIIVAINKIDKPDANPTRVINELLQHEIVVESLGGETQAIEVSATQKLGLDHLVEGILLQAELMDLRANPERSAEGTIIEAKLDKGRGPVATVLVNRGTLKRGDIIVAGSAWGRVRALVNERGEQVPTAGPSEPVEILGLNEAPAPGEALALWRTRPAPANSPSTASASVARSPRCPSAAGASLADMMAKLQSKKVSELPVIIKADVQGSAEAISSSLEKMGNEEVRARIIHSGVGGITESDVLLAKGSGSPIIGFNVRASKQARDLAEREGVEIRYYAIIYDLLDDIRGVLSGMLAPLQRENFLGNALILEVFDITKAGKVAGCRVSEGVVRRGARVRIIRQDVVVLELGVLQSLRRFKDDVAEVTNGMECGMTFTGFQDIKVGDSIECFTLEQVARTL